MIKENRHATILKLLAQHGDLQVTTLASMLSVSDVTIRKDLTELEKSGKLYRSHGKAIRIEPYTANRSVNEKEKHFPSQKAAIARAAAALISPNDSVLIASGTTMHALAREIDPENPLTVVTASLGVSGYLAQHPKINVIQLGGTLRHSSLSVVGKDAERMLEAFACSKLFLGVDGMDLDFGFTTTDLREAELNQAMMNAALKTIVLADSSKFGRRGFSRIGRLEDIDLIITDSGIAPNYIKQIEDAGIELRIVDDGD